MSFILPLIFLLLTNLTNVVVFKKSFGKLIPLAFIIPTLIMYLTGIIFDSLIPGYIISILYSLIGIGYVIYKFIKKDLKTIKDNYFDLGFILFMIIYVLVFVMNIGRHFTWWDEYGFWGYAVKHMLPNNKLFIDQFLYGKEVYLGHPPFISIWEYFICKLSGGYSEATLTFAIQLFEFTILIPFASYLNVKDKLINKIIKSFLLVISTFLIIYQMDIAYTATNSYTDIYMMLYFAYIFGIVIFMNDFKDKSNIIIFVLAASGALLNKQIMLPLYLVIIFYLVLKALIDKKQINKKTILVFALMFIIPFLFNMTWGMYLNFKYSGTGTALTGGILNNIIDFIKGTNREFPRSVISQYITSISEAHIFESPLINLSYFPMIFIGLAALVIIKKRYQKEFDNSKFISIFWSIVVAALGYAFTFMILYAFGVFSADEGYNCASYTRYFSTFVIGIYAIILIMYLNIKSKEKNIKIEYKTILLIMTIVFITTSTIKIFYFMPQSFRANNNNTLGLSKFINNAEILKNNVESGKKVLIISNDIQTPTYTRYYVPELKIEQTKWCNEKYFLEQENYLEEFPKYLLKYDYLFVSDSYKLFEDNFGYLFENKIEDQKVYEIVKDGKNITLKVKN